MARLVNTGILQGPAYIDASLAPSRGNIIKILLAPSLIQFLEDLSKLSSGGPLRFCLETYYYNGLPLWARPWRHTS